MQDRHVGAIASQAFRNRNPFGDTSLPTADKIKNETTNLPDGMRTPTDEEINQMQVFAMKYKKQHKKASRREVRRAITRKFNVQILPNTIDY